MTWPKAVMQRPLQIQADFVRTGRASRMSGALLLGIAFATALPLHAASASAQPLSWPLALRSDMLRLNEVEWRLRSAAGKDCPAVSAATGLTIDYIGAYTPPERAALRGDLRMAGLAQIAAVASGSPADLAGIRPGDAVVSLRSDAAGPADYGADAAELLGEEMMDWLARQPSGQLITFDLQRGGVTLRKTLRPVPLCAGRAILKTETTLDAYGDQSNLAVTTGMIAFTQNDDELALIVGHELAHLIVRDPPDGPPSALRKRERQADILGAALAHCAGYDVLKGAAFWPRYRDQDASRWSRLPTHDSPALRQASIVAAAPGFTCPVSRSAQAWSKPK